MRINKKEIITGVKIGALIVCICALMAPPLFALFDKAAAGGIIATLAVALLGLVVTNKRVNVSVVIAMIVIIVALYLIWWRVSAESPSTDSETSPFITAAGGREAVSFMEAPLCETVEIHDKVLFGNFEQDGNPDTADALIWTVLERDEDKLLLLSEKGIVYRPFEDRNGNAMYWSESDMRRWLSDVFRSSAFNSDERELIAEVTNITPPVGNLEHLKTDVSRDTVFLLSCEEAETYLTEDELICIPTVYALSTFGGMEAHPEGDHWWLRSPGDSLSYVSCVRGFGAVGDAGTINKDGSKNVGGGILVRPAVWVRYDPELVKAA